MADQPSKYPMPGGCDCGSVRYRLTSPPLVVQACSCSWRKRETGSAFVLNALIETPLIEPLPFSESPEIYTVPSESGRGQNIFRCPRCMIAVFSHHGKNNGDFLRLVRVGTLDDPGLLPPEVFIYTESKLPWVVLPEGVPAVKLHYEEKEKYWRKESVERWEKIWPRMRDHMRREHFRRLAEKEGEREENEKEIEKEEKDAVGMVDGAD